MAVKVFRFFLAAMLVSACLIFSERIPGGILQRDESALLTRIASLPIHNGGGEKSVPNGFQAFGGDWSVIEGDGTNWLTVSPGSGHRLLLSDPGFAELESGEFVCKLWIPEREDGFSGICIKVSESGVGADHFNGLEIGLNPKTGILNLGAHRQNYIPLKTIPVSIPVGRPFELKVRFEIDAFTVFLDGEETASCSGYLTGELDPLRRGGIAFRSWGSKIYWAEPGVRSFDSGRGEEVSFYSVPITLSEAEEIPETLETEELPPIVLLVRAPLSRPNSVGNDLWQGQPLEPGAEIRIVDFANPAEPVKTVFADPDGSIYDMNLSFDAKTIFFSRQEKGEPYRHLWKIGIDGNGLTRLTSGPFYDVSPCELPNGDLVFVSTRRFGYTVCQPGPASNLFTISRNRTGEFDSKSIKCVSMDTLSDMTPQVLADGRILFTRWEYIDRDLTYRQSLWTQNPDGTAYQLYFGNTIRDVGSFLQARPFSGDQSSRVIATFAPHHGWPHGAIGEIDRSAGVEGEKGKGFVYWSRENGSVQDTSQEWGYCCPFPIADDAALCAYGEDSLTLFPESPKRFKIWLLDRDGNRRLIYEDEKKSCFNPILLEERERPVLIPPRVSELFRLPLRPNLMAEQVFSDWKKEDRSAPGETGWGIPELINPLESDESKIGDLAASILLVDVYDGLGPTIERGRVKRLRIMEQIRKTEDLDARAFDQSPVMGYGTYYAKRCWGEVPVEEDGSASFWVPALREIYFQALDEEGKEIQRMTSAVQLMPGEQLSCMGCHEPREMVRADTDSAQRIPAAAQRAPSLPVLPEQLVEMTATRPNKRLDAGIIDYPSIVQPILDRYCTECHSGGDPAGGYNLTGDLTRYFSVSYENLLGRSKSYRQYDMLTGEYPASTEKELPLVQFFWLLWTPSGVNPPLSAGTAVSRLPDYFKAVHCRKEIPDAELRLIYLWIDADVPYYGTFANSRPKTFGKRDLWALPNENRMAPWYEKVIKPVWDERCAECHARLDAEEVNRHPAENGETAWNGRFAWIDLTRPEDSALLTAHLPKEAGGRGISAGERGELIFTGRDDPYWQKLFEAICAGAAEAAKCPRADQAGFHGRPEP